MKKYIIFGLLLSVSIVSYSSEILESVRENRWLDNQILSNELPDFEIISEVPKGKGLFSQDCSDHSKILDETMRLIANMTYLSSHYPGRFGQMEYQIKTIERFRLDLEFGRIDLKEYCRLMNIMEYYFAVMLHSVH